DRRLADTGLALPRVRLQRPALGQARAPNPVLEKAHLLRLVLLAQQPREKRRVARRLLLRLLELARKDLAELAELEVFEELFEVVIHLLGHPFACVRCRSRRPQVRARPGVRARAALWAWRRRPPRAGGSTRHGSARGPFGRCGRGRA